MTVIKCKNKATLQYSWEGDTNQCCEKHGHQISAVGKAIGIHVLFQRIITDDICPNVDEEEKK